MPDKITQLDVFGIAVLEYHTVSAGTRLNKRHSEQVSYLVYFAVYVDVSSACVSCGSLDAWLAQSTIAPSV